MTDDKLHTRDLKISKGDGTMRKKIALLLFIPLIILIFSPSVYAGDAFLWKVESKTATVYLLGSIHFMKKEIYPLNRMIENAFDKADILVVEADINDIGKIDIQKLMETAFYRENDTLQNHISGEAYELVKKEFEGLGMPLWIVDKQRPWFLALTLTSLELVKLGYDPNYGIDNYFLSKASGKKRIKELESLDYQMNLLSGFSDNEQELFLVYTIKDLKTLDQEVTGLIRAWKSGDTKSMESIITKSATENGKMSSIYEKLIYGRNKNMASKVEDFLKTKDAYFVIVGAGHLVG
jgi:uncharacterized protein YbaP (TraB family)